MKWIILRGLLGSFSNKVGTKCLRFRPSLFHSLNGFQCVGRSGVDLLDETEMPGMYENWWEMGRRVVVHIFHDDLVV